MLGLLCFSTVGGEEENQPVYTCKQTLYGFLVADAVPLP
jgi:hypothetical protein